MSDALSVVVPVHDEAPHLASTLHALVRAVGESPFEAEVVVVDDGSTDGSADVARLALDGSLPLTLVTQPNAGRFAARRVGVDRAQADFVLLLDSRVRLRRESLAFAHGRVAVGETVWNGHVHVDVADNPYAAFANVLVELAWKEYFDDPRTTSYGAEDFDRYPKGTTCFLAPRQLLRRAMDGFESRYEDLRFANDDTPVLRWIAERERIHLSPSFACDYRSRATLTSFLRHSFHRGTVFLDGHGRPESGLFPAVVAFYPTSAALAVLAARRPSALPVLALGATAAAAGLAHMTGRSAFETASFAALAPVYAVAHGAGMWRGLALMAASARRRRPANA
jgi:glycosyltransferase involved in cell wall biosynthesis